MRQYRKALQIHREVGNRQGEIVDLHNLSDVYDRMADSEAAASYRAEAEKIEEEMGKVNAGIGKY